MGHQAAAQQLRAATPEIIEAYRAALRRLGSPLVSREDIWRQCRHQAENIVAECAQTLEARPARRAPGGPGVLPVAGSPPRYQGIRGDEEAQRPSVPEAPERDSEALVDAADTQVLDLLTLRERQFLEAVPAGLTNRPIGRRFEISEATVKRHLHNAYRKLGAGSRVQALNKAFPGQGLTPMRAHPATSTPPGPATSATPNAAGISRFAMYCVTMNAR